MNQLNAYIRHRDDAGLAELIRRKIGRDALAHLKSELLEIDSDYDLSSVLKMNCIILRLFQLLLLA